MNVFDVFRRSVRGYSTFLAAMAYLALHGAAALGQACTTPPSGLKGWWQAEANPSDVAGGNAGALKGDVSYETGEVGLAFKFDGTGDAVVIGNPTVLQLQSFTVEAWIRRSSRSQASFDADGVAVIFGYSLGGYAFGIFNDGRLLLSKVGESGINSTLSVTDTNWHHVAVTKAGNSVAFYVDGVAESTPAYDPGFVFTSRATH